MVGALPWLFWFDPNKAPSVSRQRRTDTTAANAQERRLCCIACRQIVTHLDERIAVNGATEHTVRNPCGIEFHIGCFRSAYGCRASGAATQAYTWFPGYAWRLARCGKCGLHLGWRYHASADSFHGLILNRLTARASSAGP